MLIINYLFSIAAVDFVLGLPYVSSNVPFPTHDFNDVFLPFSCSRKQYQLSKAGLDMEWQNQATRRDKAQELCSKGYNQREISQVLQVGIKLTLGVITENELLDIALIMCSILMLQVNC
jgi:hypothetical protein